MKTTENNKLIAEFMGVDVVTNKEHYFMPPSLQQELKLELYCNICSPSIIQFHSSWDWLMPVVEKIEKLDYKLSLDKSGGRYLVYLQKVETFVGISDESRKEAIYKAVVEFIKWYNENNL